MGAQYIDFYKPAPSTQDPKVIPKYTRGGQDGWQYDWTNLAWLEVTDDRGVEGQKLERPFTNHVVVWIKTPGRNFLYDPSYGTTYTSVQNLQDKAIEAFYTTGKEKDPAGNQNQPVSNPQEWPVQSEFRLQNFPSR
jgi:hypothetical protein